jgi:hypothetical protein
MHVFFVKNIVMGGNLQVVVQKELCNNQVIGEIKSPMLRVEMDEKDTTNLEVNSGNEGGMEEVVVAKVVGMESKLVMQQNHLKFES